MATSVNNLPFVTSLITLKENEDHQTLIVWKDKKGKTLP